MSNGGIPVGYDPVTFAAEQLVCAHWMYLNNEPSDFTRAELRRALEQYERATLTRDNGVAVGNKGGR
jgi:hypothetical protein